MINKFKGIPKELQRSPRLLARQSYTSKRMGSYCYVQLYCYIDKLGWVHDCGANFDDACIDVMHWLRIQDEEGSMQWLLTNGLCPDQWFMLTIFFDTQTGMYQVTYKIKERQRLTFQQHLQHWERYLKDVKHIDIP